MSLQQAYWISSMVTKFNWGFVYHACLVVYPSLCFTCISVQFAKTDLCFYLFS